MIKTELAASALIIIAFSMACEPERVGDTIISINCTGSVVIRSMDGQTMPPCSTSPYKTICGPVELITTDCRKILVGSDCPEKLRGIDIQVIILWMVLAIIIIGLVVGNNYFANNYVLHAIIASDAISPDTSSRHLRTWKCFEWLRHIIRNQNRAMYQVRFVSLSY